jgi:hypothetical protein
MGDLGMGAGLAALAFWGFVAVAVVATTWSSIRKRDAQHETLRRLIESGQPMDGELVNELLKMGESGSGRPDRDFKVTALWMLPVSAGLAVFAPILGLLAAEAFIPLIGAAALCACMGVGWLIAAKITSRWYTEDADPARNQLGV